MKNHSAFEEKEITLSANWEVRWNKILAVDPSEVDLASPTYQNHLLYYFVQDMFWAENSSQSLGIDVGWIPEGEPNGQYHLQIIKKDQDSWDYLNPVFELQTRSLEELLASIDQFSCQSNIV